MPRNTKLESNRMSVTLLASHANIFQAILGFGESQRLIGNCRVSDCGETAISSCFSHELRGGYSTFGKCGPVAQVKSWKITIVNVEPTKHSLHVNGP